MLTVFEFAMKFGKKFPRSWLTKIGNSEFFSKYIEDVRKKGFDNWCQLDHGIKMYFDPTDPHLLDMIDRKDPEQTVKEIFLENITSGDVVIDVGANIGDYALIASKKVGDSGKVLAFEPLSETFSTLTRNLQLNEFTHCIPFQKAVGEKSGIMNLYKSNKSGTMGYLDSSLNEQNLIKKNETEVVTIDDVLYSNHIENVNMMKIDVEGFEHEVLLGCSQSFKENKIKKILCEVHFKYLESKGKSEKTIYDLLREHNFNITPISDRTSNRVHILATL